MAGGGMKNKVAIMIIFAAILAALSIGQGPVRPVTTLMNDIGLQESVYFRENGQYADPTDIPNAKADLTRIQEEGYTWAVGVEFNKDGKATTFHAQSWKWNDCPTGGLMSYYIQQKDVLRYKCSVKGEVAQANDAKVE
jgi:hypothetical protein